MKPLYWKLVLILGAVLVAASLVLPKALRKTHGLVVNNVAQTLYFAKSEQATVFQSTSKPNLKSTYKLKSKRQSNPSLEIVSVFKTTAIARIQDIVSLQMVATKNNFVLKEVRGLSPIFSVGARPVKSRVID